MSTAPDLSKAPSVKLPEPETERREPEMWGADAALAEADAPTATMRPLLPSVTGRTRARPTPDFLIATGIDEASLTSEPMDAGDAEAGAPPLQGAGKRWRLFGAERLRDDSDAARPTPRWPYQDGWSTAIGTGATTAVAFAVMGVCAVLGASLAPAPGDGGQGFMLQASSASQAPAAIALSEAEPGAAPAVAPLDVSSFASEAAAPPSPPASDRAALALTLTADPAPTAAPAPGDAPTSDRAPSPLDILTTAEIAAAVAELEGPAPLTPTLSRSTPPRPSFGAAPAPLGAPR